MTFCNFCKKQNPSSFLREGFELTTSCLLKQKAAILYVFGCKTTQTALANLL